MKKLLLLFVASFLFSTSQSQTPKSLLGQLKIVPPNSNLDSIPESKKVNDRECLANNLAEDTSIYTKVKQNPKFPGDLYLWLSNHIEYPEQAKDSNLQGIVYASFVVEMNGSVSRSKIVKGINKLIDEEVLEVISEMPKWEPGRNNKGQIVRVQFTLPIHFSNR